MALLEFLLKRFGTLDLLNRPSCMRHNAKHIRSDSRFSISNRECSLHPSIELLGFLAATCTTFASLPQIVKIMRDRHTADISLGANVLLSSGIFLWAIYGFAIGSLSMVMANSFSLMMILGIVVLKLRYG